MKVSSSRILCCESVIMYSCIQLFLLLLLTFLNCDTTLALKLISTTTFLTSSIPTWQTVPAAPTVIPAPTRFQELRCNTNATCLPNEFCYDPDRRVWFDKSSIRRFGICLGKDCEFPSALNTAECRLGQVCNGLSVGIAWTNGRCLDSRSCSPTAPSCGKGWTCEEVVEGEHLCAPDGFSWSWVGSWCKPGQHCPP
jgi:hypothetical protein